MAWFDRTISLLPSGSVVSKRVMWVASLDLACFSSGRPENVVCLIDFVNDEVEAAVARWARMQDDMGAAAEFENYHVAQINYESHADLGVEGCERLNVDRSKRDVADSEARRSRCVTHHDWLSGP